MMAEIATAVLVAALAAVLERLAARGHPFTVGGAVSSHLTATRHARKAPFAHVGVGIRAVSASGAG
jgi:hypothetical protein